MIRSLSPGRRRPILRLAALMLFIALATVLALTIRLPTVMEIRDVFGAVGGWGPALFIVSYAALTLAPVPKSVLSIAAGVVFGWAGGVAVVWVSAMLGAAAAFWLGRWLGREAVERLTGSRVDAVDALLVRRGLLAVIAVRLVPVLPFTAINYSAGLTAIGWWPYVLGTAVGILPGTVSFVALGAAGLQPSWQFGLAAGALGVLTLGGLVGAALYRRREGRNGV